MTEASPRTQPVGDCPVCGRSQAPPYFAGPDRMHGVPGVYHYRRCIGCGSVYQDPRVVDEDLRLLYPGGYYTRRAGPLPLPVTLPSGRGRGLRGRIRAVIQDALAPATAADAPPVSGWGRVLASNRWLRERASYDLVPDEMLPWKRPAGRALDVGCGSGELMLRLAALGWRVEGVEVDPETAAGARERTGLEVRVGRAEDLRREDLGTFDLVTGSHVLEHLADPGRALRALCGLVNPGGRVVLIYPNPRSLAARVFGEHWFSWDAPRHLVLPPLEAVPHLLGGRGLTVRSLRTLGRLAADHSMQSSAYRQRKGLQSGSPGLLDRAFAGVEWFLVASGWDVGEEILLTLEAGR